MEIVARAGIPVNSRDRIRFDVTCSEVREPLELLLYKLELMRLQKCAFTDVVPQIKIVGTKYIYSFTCIIDRRLSYLVVRMLNRFSPTKINLQSLENLSYDNIEYELFS